MKTEYLRLLGPAEYRRPRSVAGSEVEVVRFRPDKRYQLLAYLAYVGEWVSRQELAYLFWPDTATSVSLQNLRELLQRVRALSWLGGLEVDRHGVCWPVSTDVAEFRAALTADDPERAVRLYRGPLLKGLESDRAEQFNNWLCLERDGLADRHRAASLDLAARLESQGRLHEAASRLQPLLEADDLDEEAIVAFMRVKSLAGKHGAALKQFDTFTRRLREELNMEPGVLSQALAQAIRQAADAPEAVARALAFEATSTPAASVPVAAGSTLVGREGEIAVALERLERPECRLLTVTGAGGAGKSRLAAEVAHRARELFPDGCVTVGLASYPSILGLPARIAAALGLEPPWPPDVFDLLRRELAETATLLVLDDFEHLVEGSSNLLALLATCPGLKLLVTSRERLRLDEEWLLPLEGLSTDLPAELPDATRLFVQRARRADPTFSIDGDRRRCVDRICGLVEGLPLAIELAAAWVRILPPEQIATEIRASADFLTASTRTATDQNSRHRSMRAVFEHSWGLLVRKERQVLTALSVFRGGFTVEAARSVANGSLVVLASLVDKSLIRLSERGRYDRHPLLYEYSREKLAEDPSAEQTARDRHAAWVLDMLRRRESDLTGSRQKGAIDEIGHELQNLDEARRWLLDQGRTAELEAFFGPLGYFFDFQARYSEGLDFFRKVDQASCSAVEDAYQGRVLVEQAWFHHRLGEYEVAEETGRRGLDLLRARKRAETEPDQEPPVAVSKGELRGLLLLASNSWRTGNYSEAREGFRQALELARRLRDGPAEADCLANLATVSLAVGQYAEAQEQHEHALSLFRRFSDNANVVRTLNNMAAVSIDLHRWKEANELLAEGLELARQLDFRRFLPHLLANLANVRRELGDPQSARSLGGEALTMARESGEKRLEAGMLADLAVNAMSDGNLASARELLLESLQLGASTKNTRVTLYTLVRIARIHALTGKPQEAACLARLALAHPSTEQQDRAFAQAVLGSVQPQLVPLPASLAQQAPSNALELDEVVEALLSRTPFPVK